MIKETKTARIIPFPSAVSGRPANTAAFQLPEHSGVIPPSLFRYYVDQIDQLKTGEYRAVKIGDLTFRHWCEILSEHKWLEVLDFGSVIKRV